MGDQKVSEIGTKTTHVPVSLNFWSSINEMASSGTPRTRKKSLKEDISAQVG